MINPNAYYTVQGWMISELGLKGNALAVYAIIYGFSQDGASEYAGSARYLSEWLGCSRSTIMEVLKKLVESGLLVKRDIYKNGITYCTYTTTTGVSDSRTGCPIPGQGVSDSRTGDVRNSDRGCPIPGHNNTRDIDRDNNKDIDSIQAAPASPPPESEKGKKEPVKHKYGEYKNVLLTDKELDKLKAEYPADWEIRIERLSEYIASKGAKYKSHYATIRAWANRDKKQAAPAARGKRQAIGPNGIAINPNKTDLDAYFLEAAR